MDPVEAIVEISELRKLAAEDHHLVDVLYHTP
jgi:hypothetical protein